MVFFICQRQIQRENGPMFILQICITSLHFFKEKKVSVNNNMFMVNLISLNFHAKANDMKSIQMALF